MSNEKVTQLPTVTNSQNSDILYAVQSGISVQETVQQLSNRIFNNIAQTYAGNPNGNVAGSQLQYLYDSANDIVWICKTAGTETTAVWVPYFGAMANGQIVIGSTGSAPVLANITAGFGINITNGPGSIQISSTGVTSVWTEVTGTSQALLPNNSYIINNIGLVSLSLPISAGVGDRIEIVGKGAGGWKITQSLGQQIIVGANATTSGAGGYLQSKNQHDSLVLICTVANTTFTALCSPIGPLTIA